MGLVHKYPHLFEKKAFVLVANKLPLLFESLPSSKHIPFCLK